MSCKQPKNILQKANISIYLLKTRASAEPMDKIYVEARSPSRVMKSSFPPKNDFLIPQAYLPGPIPRSTYPSLNYIY